MVLHYPGYLRDRRVRGEEGIGQRGMSLEGLGRKVGEEEVVDMNEEDLERTFQEYDVTSSLTLSFL